MLTQRPRRRLLTAVLVTLSCCALAACGGSSSAGSQSSSSSHSVGRGSGSFTVLESPGNAGLGVWPAGLDPATDTTGPANQGYMDAIFGELFELGSGGTIIPDLATGYRFENGGKRVVISLRSGVRFSDGTPFDAAAVIWNIKRDLSSSCSCRPAWAVSSVTSTGADTVVIDLKAPDGALIDQLQDAPVNWIASPTAVRKMGEQAFKLKPVGAGPFEVVSDKLSFSLVLKRNSHYWQTGHPYLADLTFKVTDSDESALEAMQAGQAQAYEDMSTATLVHSYQAAHLTETAEPSTSPYAIQLNTSVAPFNNIIAREAIYYATDAHAIDEKLFGDRYPVVQSFTSPDGLFYARQVPGYRAYDLARARALVKSLGGMNVSLFSVQAPVDQLMLVALQQMWEQAGIKTSINMYSLGALVQQFQGKKWQAALSEVGSWDPAGNDGIALYFSSLSPFSGVRDPRVDTLLLAAQSAVNAKARAGYYSQLGDYISDKAYAAFMFPGATWNIAAPGASGPGLTTSLPSMIASPQILWEDVRG